MAGKSLIGALRVTLGLDSAEFTRGASKAKQEMSLLQKGAGFLKTALVGMIGLETINQFRQLGRAALDNVGGLAEQAAQIGINTDALQTYRFIALQTGVEQGSLDKGLQQLTRRLGEAAAGAKAPSKALKDLGVELKDSQGKVRDTDAVLLDIIGGLEGVEGAAGKAAVAKQLFGKSAQDLMPLLQEGKAKIKAYADEAKRLGVIIDEETIANSDKIADELAVQDKVIEMRMNALLATRGESIAKLETFWQDIKLGAVDAGGSIITFFEDWTRNAKSWQAEVDGFDAKIAAKLAQTWQGFENFNSRMIANGQAAIAFFATLPGRIIASVQQLVMGVGQWLGTRMNAVFDGLKKKVSEAGDWFYNLWDRVVGHSYIPDMVDEIGVQMRRLDGELVKPAKDNTDKAAAAFRALEQTVAGILARLFPEQARLMDFEKEKAALDAFHKAGKISAAEHAAAVEALRREFVGLHRDRAAMAPGEAETQIELTAGGPTIEEMSEEVSGRAGTALGKLGKSAEDLRVKFVDSFAGMFDGALREVDRFVKGLKSGNILDIVGGLLNAIDKIAGIATGGKGTNIFGFQFGGGGSGSVPGFATGGSMRLGGYAGVDRNLLSLNGKPLAKVSAGESMQISPANDRGAGANGQLTVRLEKDGSMSAFLEGIAGKVVDERSPALVRGASMAAVAKMGRMQQKTIG